MREEKQSRFWHIGSCECWTDQYCSFVRVYEPVYKTRLLGILRCPTWKPFATRNIGFWTSSESTKCLHIEEVSIHQIFILPRKRFQAALEEVHVQITGKDVAGKRRRFLLDFYLPMTNSWSLSCFTMVFNIMCDVEHRFTKIF